MSKVIVESKLGRIYIIENVKHVYLLDGILYVEFNGDDCNSFVLEHIQSFDIGLDYQEKSS